MYNIYILQDESVVRKHNMLKCDVGIVHHNVPQRDLRGLVKRKPPQPFPPPQGVALEVPGI